MCKITSKIKFCTCKASATEKLQHYWCLYRFNKEKDDVVMGLLLPDEPLTINFEVNKVVLEKRLNEVDAFDVNLSFKPKDVLEIVCNNFNDSKRTVYGFKYKGKRWQFYEIDDFYIMGHYDEVTFGKMKN
jgi:hypothetical protein